MLPAAVALWLWSMRDVALTSMTGAGLLSVMPVTYFVALILVTVGFVRTATARPGDTVSLAAHCAVLVAVLHGTPALVYGTVRYAWSFKHLGIVEYVRRHGAVDPDAQFLSIYHGWPGLFGATATIADVTGIDPQTLALWTPLALSLASVLAVDRLARLFTHDNTTRWMATWFYVLANWVGQEYFSPQGLTFVLYVSLLAIATPLYRHRRSIGEFGRGHGPLARRGLEHWAVVALVAVAVFAIVASHQLTPIMAVVAFTVTAAMRRSRTGWIAGTTLGLMLLWIAGPAQHYMRRDGIGAVESLGSPASSTSASVLDSSRLGTGQLAVIIADRLLVATFVVLAIIGLLLQWRRGARIGLVTAMIVAPGALLVSDYGGEVLFRSYMFATPWLAIAAATAVVLGTDRLGAGPRLVVRTSIAALLLAAFSLAYLGKERTNYFTPAEVQLATSLYERAPPNTLLIEGSRNYPGSAVHYENMFYVAIDREPADSKARVVADPEGTMFRWMSNDRFATSFLVITRSMKAAEADVPSLPSGFLDVLEAALRTSERFVVVASNGDGVVFALAEEPR